MRIGIIGPISWRIPPRHYGGWELVAANLTEGLARRGHDVTLFATADSETRAELVSICPSPLSESPSLPTRAYESLHLANAFEHAAEFDIIHNNAGCYALCYSQMIATPLVTTLHGSGAEADSRLIYQRYRDSFYVSISDRERQLCPELNYVATVYNGIDVSRFSFREEPGDYLLFLGRLSPAKGVHMAMEVAERSGRPLVLAGIIAPEDQAYYRREIEPRIDGVRIRYVGPADHQRKNELMGRAFAFLHLVTYEEAFGLTIVEAMSCGTPVIAVRKGSVPEVVADGQTGFIVDDVDQASQAAARIGAISRRDCRSRAENHFDVERMVDGYLKVYHKVLSATLPE
jgi:glycosyltransferase involved in cell wall biosynthesis